MRTIITAAIILSAASMGYVYAQAVPSIAGKSFYLPDEGTYITYSSDGRYAYQGTGKWHLEGNKVCVDVRKRDRCDTLQWQGDGSAIMYTERGTTDRLIPVGPSVPGTQGILSGRTFRLTNRGRTVTYGHDGSYLAEDGGRWRQQGAYVCVDFDNGTARCDQLEFRDGVPIRLYNKSGYWNRMIPR